MTNRMAAIGFLLVFYALRSCNSHHMTVTIDFYCSKIRPEMETTLLSRRVMEPTRSINRPLSVSYKYFKCRTRLTLAADDL
jgi:hypothetical protein